MENYILSNVKRSNRNLFIVNLLILIGVIAFLFISSRYLFNAFFGPYKMSSTDIEAIHDAGSLNKYYVTVKGGDVFNTGLSDIEERYDKVTKKVLSTTYKADYLLMVIDRKAVIIRAPHGKGKETTQTGELKNVDQDLKRDILDNAAKSGAKKEDVDELREMMLPVYIDTDDFKSSAYVEVLISLILLAFAFWNLSKFMIRTIDYNKHPIIKDLSKYGELSSLTENINDEIYFKDNRKFNNIIVTDSWLLIVSFFGLKAFRLSDVVWIYKKVTKHSVNFIPTGKTYNLVINTRYKSSFDIKLGRSEAQVNSSIDYIMSKVPWIIGGFSDEIKKVWNRNYNEIVAFVDGRRIKEAEQVPESSSFHQDNNPPPAWQ